MVSKPVLMGLRPMNMDENPGVNLCCIQYSGAVLVKIATAVDKLRPGACLIWSVYLNE